MANTSDILFDTLERWGVEVIFGLPGDGINGLMEGLRQRTDKIKFVLVRHEEAAAFAACAYSKFTGKLGACIATSGPGGIHLLNGLYDAKLDSTPVLAVTGQTYSDLIGSRYQQEVNMTHLYSDVSVYNVQVNSAEHVRMVTDNACRAALTQRGVAHINIPVDVQEHKYEGDLSKDKVPGITSHHAAALRVRPSDTQIEEAALVLERAERPVILAGSGARDGRSELLDLSNALQAPIIKALLGKDVVPDGHPNCMGGLGLLGTKPSEKAMDECDALVMVGTNFPYLSFLPEPGSVPAVQIDIESSRIGTRYPVNVGLPGDAGETLRALTARLRPRHNGQWLGELQKDMAKWRGVLHARSSREDMPMKPQAVAQALNDRLTDDAIITCDSGTIATWAARYIEMRGEQRFSLSGTLATMAPGLPYAIAAQVAYPDRQVVAFVGDGGLLMLGSELSTAAQYDLPITVVVIRNDTLGMIQWEQMAFLGKPSFGITLPNVDYVGFARSLGVKGYKATEPQNVGEVLGEALSSSGPALVECVVDPNEPPMPAHIEMKQALHMAEALARGQEGRTGIAKTMLRDKVSDLFAGKRR